MRGLLLLCFGLFSMLCFVHTAHAQIHHCIGAQGEQVFTDQPCGADALSLGTVAQPAQSSPVARDNGSPAPGDYFSAFCPRSPQELRRRVALAFADDDVNKLAGLFNWSGYSPGGADAKLRAWRQWLKRPLDSVNFTGAFDPSGALPGDADYAPQRPSGITVLTGSSGDSDDDYGGSSARSFGMVDRGGCWWLTF